MVDANYKFVYINIGAAGRAGDAEVFADSSLKKTLMTNSLNLPDAVASPGVSTKISHHIVEDHAFPLCTKVMKPFSGQCDQIIKLNYVKSKSLNSGAISL